MNRFEQFTDSELAEIRKGIECNSRVTEWLTDGGRQLLQEIKAEQVRRERTRFSAFDEMELGGIRHALGLWLKEIQAADLSCPTDEPVCQSLLAETEYEQARRNTTRG